MIIGISGKKRHGKDLLSRIICYILTKRKFPDLKFGEDSFSYAGIVGDIDTNIYYESGFTIKKFADKLKDITCILLGCTREDLEDRDFKYKGLGEEWRVYNISGKVDGSTYYSDIPFASEETARIYGESTWDYNIEIDFKTLTPREIMQKLGTEGSRDLIHPNIWINSTLSEYCSKSDINKNDSISGCPKWLITDLRFPNEAKAIKDREGLLFRINRGNCLPGFKDHISEVALDDYKEFDEIIDNYGSIEDLIEKVEVILNKYNIE